MFSTKVISCLKIMLIAGFIGLPISSLAADDWALGVNIGYSYLDPGLPDAWDEDNHDGLSWGVALNRDIGEHLGFELYYTDLGEIDLLNESTNQEDTLSLQNFGFAGLWYITRSTADWSSYAKLTMSSSNSDLDKDVLPLKEDDFLLAGFGAGVRFNINKHYITRFEVLSYSRDAKVANLQFLYRFR